MARKRTTAVTVPEPPVNKALFGYYPRLEERIHEYICLGRGLHFYCNVIVSSVRATIRVEVSTAVKVYADIRMLFPPVLYGRARAKTISIGSLRVVEFAVELPNYTARRARVRTIWDAGLMLRESLATKAAATAAEQPAEQPEEIALPPHEQGPLL
jgi:hypothetical protein